MVHINSPEFDPKGMGYAPILVWFMGYEGVMGYGPIFSLSQLGSLKNLWVRREYGLQGVWPKRELTVVTPAIVGRDRDIIRCLMSIAHENDLTVIAFGALRTPQMWFQSTDSGARSSTKRLLMHGSPHVFIVMFVGCCFQIEGLPSLACAILHLRKSDRCDIWIIWDIPMPINTTEERRGGLCSKRSIYTRYH